MDFEKFYKRGAILGLIIISILVLLLTSYGGSSDVDIEDNYDGISILKNDNLDRFENIGGINHGV